eukprot:UN24390
MFQNDLNVLGQLWAVKHDFDWLISREKSSIFTFSECFISIFCTITRYHSQSPLLKLLDF